MPNCIIVLCVMALSLRSMAGDKAKSSHGCYFTMSQLPFDTVSVTFLFVVWDSLLNLFKKISLKDMKGAGDVLSYPEHLLFLVMTWAWFIAPTWVLTTVSSSSSREN